MGLYQNTSQKKQKQIDDFLKSEIKIGESIKLTDEKCKSSYEFNKNESYEVLSIEGNSLTIKAKYSNSKEFI